MQTYKVEQKFITTMEFVMSYERARVKRDESLRYLT